MTLDFPLTLIAAGASQTFFMFNLSVGEHKEIDLVNYAVPDNATVLALGYSPQGEGCFPLELHGNIPTRRIVGTKVKVTGIQMGNFHGPVRIAAFAVWTSLDDPPVAWSYLVEALQAITMGQYSRSVVPANSAVETMLMPIVREALERHCSKTNVVNFMGDLKYSHALNVIMPLLCTLMGAQQLNAEILGGLNRLRRMRNNLVHRGLIDDVTKPQDVTLLTVAEPLCAAIFAFEYLRYIRPKLLAASK